MMSVYKEFTQLHKNEKSNPIHIERLCKMKSIGEIIHLMEESNVLPKKVLTKSKIRHSIKYNIKRFSKNYKRTTIKL